MNPLDEVRLLEASQLSKEFLQTKPLSCLERGGVLDGLKSENVDRLFKIKYEQRVELALNTWT